VRKKSDRPQLGYLFDDEDKKDRKRFYDDLKDMTVAQHEAAILEIALQKDIVRNIASKSGFRGFEEQVLFCAIEARKMQKDWWLGYGVFLKNFGTAMAARRCADRLRSVRVQLRRTGIENRLRLEAMRSTDLSMIDNDISALERIAALLDASAENPVRLGNARYDLRLMSKSPRALWAIKHGPPRIDRFERIRRGSDHAETVFIYNILRLVDRSVTIETTKNIDQGLGELLDFAEKDWRETYMRRFEKLMPIFRGQ